MVNRKRQFKRFDSNLFIEFRPLKEVPSYLLGITNNISCEGLSLTFQNVALEPGQRLQFKLKQPQTNTIISFLGDVIWQEQKDNKYSAGVKFCDAKKKNKKIMLKVISDSCNIPFNSLLFSNDIEKSLNNSIDEQAAPASAIIDTNKLNSRISNRQKINFSWLYKAIFILAMTSAVLFLPAITEIFEDVSSKPITKFIKLIATDNTKHINALFTYENGQIHSKNILTDNNSVQLQHIKNSALFEVVEENIPLARKEKDLDIKLPANIMDMAEENEFHIQVASLKDPEIAHGILSDFKQDYPAVYLLIQNDFYKVRIPDIKTSEQGYDLLKDIEAKFNIKPILVKRFH